MALVILESSNPFAGWDVVEEVSRPTETEALRKLFRWWVLVQKSKTVTLTDLHKRLMKLEVECWKKNFHWTRDDIKDVYAYVALSANLFTFENRKRVPDIWLVEQLLDEASLICQLEEYGVSFEVEETRLKRAA